MLGRPVVGGQVIVIRRKRARSMWGFKARVRCVFDSPFFLLWGVMSGEVCSYFTYLAARGDRDQLCS